MAAVVIEGMRAQSLRASTSAATNRAKLRQK
jgi:hypothetical protein